MKRPNFKVPHHIVAESSQDIEVENEPLLSENVLSMDLFFILVD